MNVSSRDLMPVVKDALQRGQNVRLTVSGSSMLPFLRNGDVVEIEPVTEVLLGDMVLVQTNSNDGAECYVLHRIVEKLNNSSQVFIRGDAQAFSEGPFTKNEVLGKANIAWRNGKPLKLDRGLWCLTGLAWMHLLPVNLWLLRFVMRGRRIGGKVLGMLQGMPFYRAIAKPFCPGYKIQEADKDDLIYLQTFINQGNNQDSNDSVQNEDSRLTIYVARSGNKILGFVRFMRYTKECFPYKGHWLFSLTIKKRYRGVGIGEALTRKVIEQSKLEGASELWLFVFEDNKPAIKMYEKLGFRHAELPELKEKLAADAKLYGRESITMRKALE